MLCIREVSLWLSPGGKVYCSREVLPGERFREKVFNEHPMNIFNLFSCCIGISCPLCTKMMLTKGTISLQTIEYCACLGNCSWLHFSLKYSFNTHLAFFCLRRVHFWLCCKSPGVLRWMFFSNALHFFTFLLQSSVALHSVVAVETLQF